MFLGVMVFVAIVAALWFVSTYNRLVATRSASAQAWSNIDVLLRERHDELPKLVEICTQYMNYEQEPSTACSRRARRSSARATRSTPRCSAEPRASCAASSASCSRSRRTTAELTANQTSWSCSSGSSGSRPASRDRRKLYNSAVNENNVAIDQFPGNVVAGMGGFRTLRAARLQPTSTSRRC